MTQDNTKNRPRATLKNIAKKAKVDVSTVSRVLSQNPNQRVSSKTKKKILEVAKGLNYEPNISARSLRVSKTFSIGIVVPQLDNPVFAEIIKGAEGGAREKGYSLVISYLEDGPSKGEPYKKLIQSNRVDGLLVTTLNKNSAILRAAKKSTVPVVVLNRKVPGLINSVYFNSSQAAKIATEFLIAQGHKRIAHLSGQVNSSSGVGRFYGYKEALEQAMIPFNPNLVEVSGYSILGGSQATEKLLANPKAKPTAIFALTLNVAVGAMMALQKNGFSVPKDMSIVAIHDGPIASALHPPLTTVQMPSQKMGYEGAIGLINLIEKSQTKVLIELDPGDLIIRESVKKLSKNK
jgi:LacI family transcriptional regulator